MKKRGGFTLTETVFAMLLASGILVTASKCNISIMRAARTARETYLQIQSEDNAFTQLYKDLKSGRQVSVSDEVLIIVTISEIITYEAVGRKLYRNGELILNEPCTFNQENGFVKITTAQNNLLKVWCEK